MEHHVQDTLGSQVGLRRKTVISTLKSWDRAFESPPGDLFFLVFLYQITNCIISANYTLVDHFAIFRKCEGVCESDNSRYNRKIRRGWACCIYSYNSWPFTHPHLESMLLPKPTREARSSLVVGIAEKCLSILFIFSRLSQHPHLALPACLCGDL